MVTCGVRGGGGKNCQIFADAICDPLSFYFPDMAVLFKDLMFNGQILISQFLYDCYFLISPYCPFILGCRRLAHAYRKLSPFFNSF